MAQFVDELRRIAQHCEFGPALDDMLRDRLVCGLRDDKVQRRLLADSQLTFAKAFEVAQASELAEQGVRALQPPVTGVNSIQEPTEHGDGEVHALNTQPKDSRSHWESSLAKNPVRIIRIGTEIAPRLKCYKNASRSNRYNFPTITLSTSYFQHCIVKWCSMKC